MKPSLVVSALILATALVSRAQQTPPPVRVWGHGALGHDYIESLVRKWESGYQQLHPDVLFDNQLHGTASAMGSLWTDTGDIAIMGREIWPVEVEAFHDVRGHAPVGVDVVTGSLDVRNKDFALVVFTHSSNPLRHLSTTQLARLFAARQAPPRTWGDLGLTGAWASRPIHLYGFEIHRGFGYYMQQRLFGGSSMWNPELVEIGDLRRPDGELLDAGQRIVDAIGADPDAIGYSSLLYKNADVRPVAIGPPGGPYLQATKSTIADHSYLLTRSITAYIDPLPDHALNPNVIGFLRYVLSPAGQAAVAEDGGYTPLTPSLARVQARKLLSVTSARHSKTH